MKNVSQSWNSNTVFPLILSSKQLLLETLSILCTEILCWADLTYKRNFKILLNQEGKRETVLSLKRQHQTEKEVCHFNPTFAVLVDFFFQGTTLRTGYF